MPLYESLTSSSTYNFESSILKPAPSATSTISSLSFSKRYSWRDSTSCWWDWLRISLISGESAPIDSLVTICSYVVTAIILGSVVGCSLERTLLSVSTSSVLQILVRHYSASCSVRQSSGYIFSSGVVASFFKSSAFFLYISSKVLIMSFCSFSFLKALSPIVSW